MAKDTKHLNSIAKRLEEMQANENNGRGICCVRDIVSLIRSGDIEKARLVSEWDGDKLHRYPEIRQFICENLVDIGMVVKCEKCKTWVTKYQNKECPYCDTIKNCI